MTIMTDGKRVVGITMMVWEGNGYSEDYSADFFEIGSLPWRETWRGCEYIVEDLAYCIDQANDWEHHKGDYRDDDDARERRVDVDEMAWID